MFGKQYFLDFESAVLLKAKKNKKKLIVVLSKIKPANLSPFRKIIGGSFQAVSFQVKFGYFCKKDSISVIA